MGNHEFCLDCGESSFHIGRPCDPELLAKEKALQKEMEDRVKRLDAAVQKVCVELNALGYPAKVGGYGHVVIERWDLDARHKHGVDKVEGLNPSNMPRYF